MNERDTTNSLGSTGDSPVRSGGSPDRSTTVILRIPIAEIRRHEATAPGYAAALFVAGSADEDGAHWRIPETAWRLIRHAHGHDLDAGCSGCGQ